MKFSTPENFHRSDSIGCKEAASLERIVRFHRLKPLMNYSLADFFDSLKPEIRVKLDDYERIRLVLLRTRAAWDLQTLKGVLLALIVQNREEEEIFRYRFDAYFSLALKDAQEQLRSLKEMLDASEPETTPEPEPQPDSKPESSKSKVDGRFSYLWLRKLLVGLVTIVVLVGIGYGVYRWIGRTPPNTNGNNNTSENGDKPRIDDQQETSLEVIIPEPPTPDKIEVSWQDYVGNVAVVGIPLAGFFLAWWSIELFNLVKRPKEDEPDDAIEPPPVDLHKPRLFRLGDIGGKPEPFLDLLTLNQLADSLSYFQSEELSKRLDTRASVEAIGRKGGLPSLIFKRRKQLRSVYVLVDANAEPLVWNPVPQEFAEGMRHRGINVGYGRFYGSPTRFVMQDGSMQWLDEMEGYRNDIIILFFSDSKCLRPHRDSLVLKSLALWPQVAWMELREPLFWDQSTGFVARRKIPLYPATATGLRHVMERFLTEKGRQKDYSDGHQLWRGAPPVVEDFLHDSLERLLGNALAWAQACAMIQPVTLGLADALRRSFQPHLPPERIERLFHLPNTSASVAGLQFATPVLAILRDGFKTRWSDEQQEAILRFVEEKIAQARPKKSGGAGFADEDSLAHLSWEMALERVHLEREPDQAVKRLEQLARTPLEGAIRDNLSNVVLPGDSLTEEGSLAPSRVPLRLKPEEEAGLKSLANLADKIDALPEAETKELVRKISFEDLRALAAEYRKNLFERLHKQFFGPKPLKDRLPRHLLIGENLAAFELWMDPSQLEFDNCKANRTYSQDLLIVSGLGQASPPLLSPPAVTSDVNWLRCSQPVEEESYYGLVSYRVEVTLDTKQLANGEHGAKLTISQGVEVAVPVRVTVAEPFPKRLERWWQETKVPISQQLSRYIFRVAILALGMMIVLPANWLNRLYNNAPKVENINVADSFDKTSRQVPLMASVKDDDNDALEYEWEFDNKKSGYSASPEYMLDLTDSTASGEKVVKLRIKDARGARALYVAKINVEEKPIELPIDPTPTPPPTSESELVALALVYKDKSLLGTSQLTVRDASGKEADHTLSDNQPKRIPLRPGEYYLKFEKNGYAPIEKNITLDAGETNQTTVEFIKDEYGNPIRAFIIRMAILDSQGNPVIAPNFSFLIDGQQAAFQNLTPGAHVFSTTVGTHAFSYKADGYERWSSTIRILERPSDNPQIIQVRLKPSATVAVGVREVLAVPNWESFLDLYNRAQYEGAQDAIRNLKIQYAFLNRLLQKISAQISSIVKSGGNPEEYTSLFSPPKVQRQARGVYPANYTIDPPNDFVVVAVDVDDKGTVTKAEPIAGNPALFRAAQAAARQWQYYPARFDQKQPIGCSQIIKVSFGTAAGR